jgi:hypothetical protein
MGEVMLRYTLPLLALLAVPTTAFAGSPELGVEMAVGAQELPGAEIVAWTPRLTFRLDGDDAISAYARAGYTVVLAGGETNDYAVEGAVGLDARSCGATGFCLGSRLGLGLQHADVAAVSSTSSFAELSPYIAQGRTAFGVELRAHHPDGAKALQFAANVIVSVAF